MLVELEQAFDEVEADDAVKVVILRGAGSSFSAGHDLGSQGRAEREPGPDQHWTYRQYGGTKPPVEQKWAQERKYYLTLTRRLRDISKISVASARGPVYAAGLMLMWACDLIVADETTTFADPVGTRMGMCGVEYFAHPWELGPRRTKELLLLGDSLTVEQAYEIGMVSRIFPSESLDEFTLDYARRIAEVPSFTATMIKESVNKAQDAQGFQQSLDMSFSLHELNHAYWLSRTENRASSWTQEFGGRAPLDAAPIVPAAKDRVR